MSYFIRREDADKTGLRRYALWVRTLGALGVLVIAGAVIFAIGIRTGHSDTGLARLVTGLALALTGVRMVFGYFSPAVRVFLDVLLSGFTVWMWWSDPSVHDLLGWAFVGLLLALGIALTSDILELSAEIDEYRRSGESRPPHGRTEPAAATPVISDGGPTAAPASTSS